MTEQTGTVALAVPVPGEFRRQDVERRRSASAESQLIGRGEHLKASSLGVVVVGRVRAGVEG
ncbi:hypothetical protein [Micromonospora sp. WMMD1155]|uniref:hypothetical protein n=1 Tax=Micromonospora sp. WMMD1155 TaxID=3016094 RepID=UPI00249BC549|nr:hypothetical protein [Micromonospora sp. WMMD1155]